jgi:hypothetical protein
MSEPLIRQAHDMPPATPELVLFRVQTEALLSVLGRKKGERFLRTMGEKLMDEANFADVAPIRRNADTDRIRVARREAAEAYARFLPIWLARLPRD